MHMEAMSVRTWMALSVKFGDALRSHVRVNSEMHMEAAIE